MDKRQQGFSLGVTNLRRLKSVEPADIRPITILVGRNTSGKSSFLRIFPLVRQSLMTRIRSPILWYGDFVDFGDFQGAIYQNNVKLSMDFKFIIRGLSSNNPSIRQGDVDAARRFVFGDVELTVSIGQSKETATVLQISLRLLESDDHIKINFSGLSPSIIALNGREVQGEFSGYLIQKELGSLFPDILVWKKDGESSTPTYQLHTHNLLQRELLLAVHGIMPGNVSIDRSRRIANELANQWPVGKEQIARSFMRATLGSVRDRGERIQQGFYADFTRKLIELCKINKIFLVLISALDTTRDLFLSSLYISPARARAERYYRYQDLAVSEIDQDGKNFPMFLNALSAKQLESFSGWVKALFGFGIQLNRSAGHISIELQTEGQTINVADTGYGISQVLPVLGQIWWARSRQDHRNELTRFYPRGQFRRLTDVLLAIEQPELHLHPAHQSHLADALAQDVAISKQPNSRRLTYVIETHSEAIINRLGELIADGVLSETDVQILRFEPSKTEEHATQVEAAVYDENGVLQNWPYGFFLRGVK